MTYNVYRYKVWIKWIIEDLTLLIINYFRHSGENFVFSFVNLIKMFDILTKNHLFSLFFEKHLIVRQEKNANRTEEQKNYSVMLIFYSIVSIMEFC